MKNDPNHRHTQPFVMYQNGLDMFGRVIESSCRLSMQFVEAMNRASQEMSQTAEEENLSAKQAVSSSMIPSTGDVESATAAVAAAMNESALHKLGTYAEKDAPRESMKETVAKARSAISAVKPRRES